MRTVVASSGTQFTLLVLSLFASLHVAACGTGNSMACDGKSSARCGSGSGGVTNVGGSTSNGGYNSTSSTVLKIEGTLIRDLSKPNPAGADPSSPDASEDGAPVILHGVNRSGTEYQCIKGSEIFDGPDDERSVQAIASWNINAVRVPLNESCWLGINQAPARTSGSTYRQAIQRYVTLLHKYNIYPILELHWVAPGEQLATGQLPMPDLDHSIDFWKDVTETFKDDLGVIFELFNEPYPNNNRDDDTAWNCWKNNCTTEVYGNVSVDGGPAKWQPVSSYQSVGFQDLVTAVRTTEGLNTTAHHVLLLGGVQYSNKLTQWGKYKPVDPANNTGAAWHVYSFNSCANVDCFNDIPATLGQTEAIVTTEFGQDDCQGTRVAEWMNWFDAHRLGYLAWSWNALGTCIKPAGNGSAVNAWSLIQDYYNPTPDPGLAQTIHDHYMTLASP